MSDNPKWGKRFLKCCLNLRKFFTLAQISKNGCQIISLSTIHPKKRWSGSGSFLEKWAKVKKILRLNYLITILSLKLSFSKKEQNLKQSSSWSDVDLVNVKSSGRLFQIFVAFSECLNFKYFLQSKFSLRNIVKSHLDRLYFLLVCHIPDPKLLLKFDGLNSYLGNRASKNNNQTFVFQRSKFLFFWMTGVLDMQLYL